MIFSSVLPRKLQRALVLANACQLLFLLLQPAHSQKTVNTTQRERKQEEVHLPRCESSSTAVSTFSSYLYIASAIAILLFMIVWMFILFSRDPRRVTKSGDSVERQQQPRASSGENGIQNKKSQRTAHTPTAHTAVEYRRLQDVELQETPTTKDVEHQQQLQTLRNQLAERSAEVASLRRLLGEASAMNDSLQGDVDLMKEQILELKDILRREVSVSGSKLSLASSSKASRGGLATTSVAAALD